MSNHPNGSPGSHIRAAGAIVVVAALVGAILRSFPAVEELLGSAAKRALATARKNLDAHESPPPPVAPPVRFVRFSNGELSPQTLKQLRGEAEALGGGPHYIAALRAAARAEDAVDTLGLLEASAAVAHVTNGAPARVLGHSDRDLIRAFVQDGVTRRTLVVQSFEGTDSISVRHAESWRQAVEAVAILFETAAVVMYDRATRRGCAQWVGNTGSIAGTDEHHRIEGLVEVFRLRGTTEAVKDLYDVVAERIRISAAPTEIREAAGT